jgi:L-aspartate oxidase
MAQRAPEVIEAGDVLVVGAGLAGLYTALKLAPRKVMVLAENGGGPGAGTSSAWAQGGIAAAVGEGDSPAAHAADTIAVGAGLVDTHMARLLADEAPARIDDLARLGVPFDRDNKGHFVLRREGAHSRARVVGVSGDRAGKAVVATIGRAVLATPSIRVLARHRARALALHEGRVIGVFAEVDASLNNGSRAPVLLRAGHVVLATGGIGALYGVTTNPPAAQGDGLAMAAEAGALVADAEFVQFHPTAIAVGRDPAPLATEALRGEGAVLVNGRGERFMLGCHPQAELAPRDVVARAIFRQLRQGGTVFLDCRDAVGARFPDAFPTVYAACREAGLDPVREKIPVAPAAHYHMGGVAADDRGRTTVPGLSVCGEVACTGAHGANRLASNSLLEALVLGARIAETLSGETLVQRPVRLRAPAIDSIAPAMRRRLRALMSSHVGLERSEEGLAQALALLRKLKPKHKLADSAVTAGLLIAAAARERRESRGSHFRVDHPDTDAHFARRTFLTLKDALAIAEAKSELRANRLAQ